MKVVFLDIDGVLNSFQWEDYKREHLPLSSYPPLPKVSDQNDPAYVEAYARRRSRSIDPATVERLNRIIDATGAKVVISSSWRGPEPTPGRIEGILRLCGLRHPLHGQTPDLSAPTRFDGADCGGAQESVVLFRSLGRWAEIRVWISAYRLSGEVGTIQPLDGYVILDDDEMTGAPRDHFVRTNREIGLTDRDAERAIQILNSARVLTPV